ncbi:putative ribonuclease H domain-containing protein [Helianthus annuus]|nr:putative ribonuclease H domain-containing protein [Helianthus annuus]KAJ0544005.1 putative ribonuclease H domain-containing protein [Helianthus annuus]
MASRSMKVYWDPPNSGWLKLNTDGSSLGNPGQSSYGGVVRNTHGEWVCGYVGNIGYNTSLAAEIWGIMMGLRFIRVMGLNNVVIETDSQAALLLITVHGVDESDPLSSMINSCKNDMAQLKCYMVHVKRDKNRCADLMARLGRTQVEDFVVYDDPPANLIPLLNEDAAGESLGLFTTM